MSAPRPICAHCGKRHGQRAAPMEIVRWKPDEERPPYRGNGIVVKEGPTFSAVSNKTTAHGVEVTGHLWTTRNVWDGETWWSDYYPFCTLRCALDYARHAYLVLGPNSKPRSHLREVKR